MSPQYVGIVEDMEAVQSCRRVYEIGAGHEYCPFLSGLIRQRGRRVCNLENTDSCIRIGLFSVLRVGGST